MLVSDWTKETEGTKWIEVAGKDDKKQFTAVMAGSITGQCLPPQLLAIPRENSLQSLTI